MNIYVVVEGEVGEKKIYESWIPEVNPRLSCVASLDDIRDNNFAILAGLGYPQYFDIIAAAIEDVNTHGNVDRLVIAVDSEEATLETKYSEVMEFLSSHNCSAEFIVIIQHFCLETWGLANRVVVRKSPTTDKLRKYKQVYDVRVDDPESLPSYNGFTRVRFAEVYLRAALQERYRNLTYTKGKPDAVMHPKYFQQVKKRFEDTNHVSSFASFLNAFI